ncbi:Tyrosinase [Cercospora beticola]|uniref:tyrosinase n=1 Tax=Cercospora beticola TaxID=122368 RepID=A0A2G5HTJ1_CERBT|nr:Tyrosinase [Cercospora beticola]PIA95850.1 Tyrosinase [Cercospora beticola]WPB07115.1 hypothetical protein RHO25_011775 [Cercospora beticola]
MRTNPQLCLLWLICLTRATSLYNHEIKELTPRTPSALPKRQDIGSAHYPITGVQNAGTPPRLEIRQLQQRPDLFNIFLLGLARFHVTPQDDKLSYYQMCAIHGRPYGMWDNVPPANGTEDNGYCVHVSNLLLPWHRPYLALFEQLLFNHMTACAEEFPAGPLRQRYARAATQVRLPYWDWAVASPNGSVYPDIVQQPRVSVVKSEGTTTIDNPLYSYKFHPVSYKDMEFDPFASWNDTKRYPTAWTSRARSQNNLIGPMLDNQLASFANRVYNLLTFYDNFTQFSNEAWYGREQNIDSIEALHDTIHAITGQQGHMTYLDYSAYDPIFWLHHVNLDRLFAIWQILHPNSYVEPMAALSSTYTIVKGSIQDADSPLEPFSKDTNGTKWTSNTVKDTRTFGYTYPETSKGDQANARAAVNRLYGSGYNGGGLIGVRDTPVTARKMRGTAGFLVDGRQRHYAASLLSDKHALNGSYAIHVFVGAFDDSDPGSWPTSPNLAGTHATFGSLRANGDVARKSLVTGGTIPLTNILVQKVSSGDLFSLEEDNVVRYLEESLQWRVATLDGEPVPAGEVSDLEVVVTLSEITPAASDQDVPMKKNFKKLTRITKGKVGRS